MNTFYRNRETDKVQSHPQSGIGESLNADEIGEDARPVKPRTSLAPSPEEVKAGRALLRDVAANPKTTEAKSGTGDSNKQKGAN